jgi:hypothetical protein
LLGRGQDFRICAKKYFFLYFIFYEKMSVLGTKQIDEAKHKFHLIRRSGRNQGGYYHQVEGFCYDTLSDAIEALIGSVQESISSDYYDRIFTEEDKIKIYSRIKEEKRCMINNSHRKGDYNAWWIASDAYDHMIDSDGNHIKIQADMRETSYFEDWVTWE